MHHVFEYVIDNSGIDTEVSYPYIGKVCAFTLVHTHINIHTQTSL